jgi:hypothetical protein
MAATPGVSRRPPSLLLMPPKAERIAPEADWQIDWNKCKFEFALAKAA